MLFAIHLLDSRRESNTPKHDPFDAPVGLNHVALLTPELNKMRAGW
jgi:hypothetical protein